MTRKYVYTIDIVNAMRCTHEKYPVIIFNNEQLPLGAVFIDHCASSHFFEDIEEELSLWFWKFTVCIGRERTENSDSVIAYSRKLKSYLINNENKVRKLISEQYVSDESPLIYEWWHDTLDIMIRTAECTTVSRWYGIPVCNE